jgi:hypothetical protein
MAHRAVLAFLDPDLDPLQRVYSAWYARYFAEGWRMDCAAEKDIKSNFLTANQYACILLNAESLLLYLVWMLSDEEFRHLPFAPHALSSQQGEEFFRALRAMFDDPNFTVEACLQRATYAQLDSIIRSRRKDDFVFPKHRKHTHMDRVRHPAKMLTRISEKEIATTLIAARDDAVRDLRALGVTINPTAPETSNNASNPTAAAVAHAVRSQDDEDLRIDGVEADESELVPPDVTNDSAVGAAGTTVSEDTMWDLLATNTPAGSSAPPPPPSPPPLPLAPAVLSSTRLCDCFHSRPARIKPVPGTIRSVTDDLGFMVDKRRACAIVSLHPKISADRLKRVHKMKALQQQQSVVVNSP